MSDFDSRKHDRSSTTGEFTTKRQSDVPGGTSSPTMGSIPGMPDSASYSNAARWAANTPSPAERDYRKGVNQQGQQVRFRRLRARRAALTAFFWYLRRASR